MFLVVPAILLVGGWAGAIDDIIRLGRLAAKAPVTAFDEIRLAKLKSPDFGIDSIDVALAKDPNFQKSEGLADDVISTLQFADQVGIPDIIDWYTKLADWYESSNMYVARNETIKEILETETMTVRVRSTPNKSWFPQSPYLVDTIVPDQRPYRADFRFLRTNPLKNRPLTAKDSARGWADLAKNTPRQQLPWNTPASDYWRRSIPSAGWTSFNKPLQLMMAEISFSNSKYNGDKLSDLNANAFLFKTCDGASFSAFTINSVVRSFFKDEIVTVPLLKTEEEGDGIALQFRASNALFISYIPKRGWLAFEMLEVGKAGQRSTKIKQIHYLFSRENLPSATLFTLMIEFAEKFRSEGFQLGYLSDGNLIALSASDDRYINIFGRSYYGQIIDEAELTLTGTTIKQLPRISTSNCYSLNADLFVPE